MTKPIISVCGLSKSYLLGHQTAQREQYSALRDVLARHAKNFVRKSMDMLRGRQIVQGDEVEEFWALRDVTFEVNEGEVLGIIGRNGAGKSTLLKILSRITEPTAGRVTLRGRVASLLEVGTGFHPELTGRENIFLNGAILGMAQSEIRRKFEAIVEFANVQTFLDTPVKRYSSGMYVRLAFAVAAHLEPEILVVDEVLAVGDVEFQRKCLGKMQDVASQGRTVLFVSHNMSAVERLCSKAVLLSNGQVSFAGSVREGVAKYFECANISRTSWEIADATKSSPHIRFLRLCDENGSTVVAPQTNVPLVLELSICIPARCSGLMLAIALKGQKGEWLMSTCPEDAGLSCPAAAGIYTFTVSLPRELLLPQSYSITPALYTKFESFDRIDDALEFVVSEDTDSSVSPGNRVGELFIPCKWLETTP